MKNLKDKATTVCGILALLCGGVITAQHAGVPIPPIVSAVAISVASVCGGVIAFLTGKNPDGSTKTSDQVDNANQGK